MNCLKVVTGDVKKTQKARNYLAWIQDSYRLR